jgi:hypothetical protein
LVEPQGLKPKTGALFVRGSESDVGGQLRQVERYLRLLAPRYFCQALEDHKPVLSRQPHIFVGSFRSAGEAQDGVAATDKSIGDRIKNLVVNGIAGANRSSFAEQRERNPFPNKWNVSGAVKR